MIYLDLEADEALSLLVAGRAVQAAYEAKGDTDKEGYLQLRIACEKLDLAIWGKEVSDYVDR